MTAPDSDIIVAPATPVGPAPRAVLRLSGVGLLPQASSLLPPGCPPLESRRGAFPVALEILRGVPIGVDLLCFAAPASATGEDVLEIHLPGAPPLVDALLQYLLDHGARLAEAGEFTRRAFLCGRLDLTQAEAVLELVSAHSRSAVLAAAQILGGSLGSQLESCRHLLLQALVEMEAGLDFEEGDSQDLEPGAVGDFLCQAILALEQGLAAEEQRWHRHEGKLRIGLCGPPNAGKTSLFQTLSQTPGLISPTAGTTRDRREGTWHLAGMEVPLTLVDYPGLGGEPVDDRDRVARRLAYREETRLDLVWLCLPADLASQNLPQFLPDGPRILVWTQRDRYPAAPAEDLRHALQSWLGTVEEVVVGDYGKTGVTALEEATLRALRQAEEDHGVAQQHSKSHQEALRSALRALRQGQKWDLQGGHQDLVAEDIRAALGCLAALVGEATPEEVLDRLFSSFCVGK